jgi:hypothetical protein
VQGNQGSIEQGQVGRESVGAQARVPRGTATSSARAGAGTVWAGSAFDLAQGLDITEMEWKHSREALDELFQS